MRAGRTAGMVKRRVTDLDQSMDKFDHSTFVHDPCLCDPPH